MQQKLTTVFLGSPDFAVPSLSALASDERFKIAAVITQPDKPAGRGQTMTPPPVKKFAMERGFDVWQPTKLREVKEKLEALSPDLLVVVAYGKLVPKDILSIPKYGCVNVHGSILPRYRGAAVLQAPILNGDDKTGATIMLMDEGLDTGPLLKIVEMPLNGTENLENVHDELSKLGANELPQTLIDYTEGKIEPQVQNGPSSYYKEIKKEDGKIDWSKPASEIERMVRAYTPWPGVFGQLAIKQEELKIVKILKVDSNILKTEEFQTGEIFQEGKKLAVKCGDGALVIEKLQMEGGKPLPAEEFLRGHADIVGKKFVI